MNALQAIRALGPIDVRSIWRDSLLRWMFAMALGTHSLNPLVATYGVKLIRSSTLGCSQAEVIGRGR